MTVEEYLAKLQEESVNGFHKKLESWVDDTSSAARVLRNYVKQEQSTS